MVERKTFIIKVEKHLFTEGNELETIFTEKELVRLTMYRDVYISWFTNPSYPDKTIVEKLKTDYDRSISQAYVDLSIIKSLLGNVPRAKKEFERHVASQMAKTAYELALNAKDKIDIMKSLAMSKAAKELSNANRLNKMDVEELPYDDIVPPTFEPVYDTKLIDAPDEKKTDALILKLRKTHNIQDIQDVDVIDD